MDLSVLKRQGTLALAGLLALTAGAGTMRANTLLAAPVVTGAVTCTTAGGLGTSATITVKATTIGSSSVTVTFVSPTLTNGLVVTQTSATNVLTTANNTAGIVFSVTAAPGCAGLTTSNSNQVQFKTSETAPTLALGNDAIATVGSTFTSNGSPLVVPAITVTCGKSGSTYTPTSAGATVSVSSAAVGGTPFTVVSASLPAWLNVSSLAGGTATTTPVTFTAYAVSPCDSLAPGNSFTSTNTITLSSPQSVTKTFNVTISVIAGSPLTAAPASISLSHVKGSGAAQTQNVAVTSIPTGTYFTVNTATLPVWLTVNTTYAFAPASLTFTTTSVTDNMPPGTYSAQVNLQTYGLGDLAIPITLFVTNSAPKLSITSANPAPITWVQGSAAPTATITAVSSDSPIPYSITTGGALAPIVTANEVSGLAYSFGTQIGVTFNPQIYQTAQPGTVITGTVSFTWGNPTSVTVVTINLTVASPGATLTGLSPATVPTGLAGQSYTVFLSGNGFVGALNNGGNAALNTKVGIVPGGVAGGVLVADANISIPNVLNPSLMSVTITIPAVADALLPFAPGGVNGVVGGPVTLGVCNNSCIGVAPATGTYILTIGGGPVIQGVTSSSSFTEVTSPALPTIAPYDMISIFGVNFCSSLGTGCATNTLLSNSPASGTLIYPAFVSPDPLPVSGADTRRKVTVTFYPHGGPYTTGLSAPILFATNGQINAIVPGGVTVGADSTDIVVGFSSNTATLTSNPFPVNIANTDPGIFTIGADGQGSAAALASGTYALITSTNPAGVRSTGSDSDTIQLYVTGMGIPTSIAAYTSADGSCIAPLGGGYLAALNASTNPAGTLTAIDGAVLQSTLYPADLSPCFTGSFPAGTIRIGGVDVAANITYAGFVADTVAGLYQINVKLPASGATYHPDYPLNVASSISPLVSPVQLPVTLSFGGANAQTGVTLWVAPRLKMVAPLTLSLLQGQPYTSGNAVVASEGSGPGTYTYAITSGVLPSGLTLNQSGGSAGTITGTPASNTSGSYTVTVTATDTSAIPLTGSVTFTITVVGGLYVSYVATPPFNASVFGSAGLSLPTLVAAGGNGTYTYTMAVGGTPTTAPIGMSVGGSSGVFATTGATKAGSYLVTVTATDTTTPTALTGTATFTDTIALLATPAALTNTLVTTAGGIQTVTTIAVTGYSGTGGTPLTCTTSDPTHFTCADAGGTITLSTVNPTGMTASTAYPVTVTVTDTATAPGAITGAGNYATATTATITVTPAT